MIGKTILHYKILSKLGEGGMGVVYLAEDTKLQRQVAIKFLPRQIATSQEERGRFETEARAAASLNHAHVATIYNIEESDDELFIVMEYIRGHELKDQIETGPMPVDDCLNLAIQIADGLKSAHSNGVVHRDIKSANIMLTDEGNVKIMDFGLAKRGGQSKLTKEGTTLGTVAYMSPEQARGDDVDPRSDIFSLGVLLYEMLTGQLPFKGDYDQAVTYSILNEDPQPVTGLRSGIPLELERIVSKCLEKDASDRYQRADELIVDLRKLRKDAETREILSQTGQKPAHQEPKRPVSLIVAIVAVVVISAMAGFWLMTGEPEITERIPIAVVDFVNETHEPELSGLSGMLITALEQSRHLDVMSRTQMLDELKKMGRTDVTFVDEATGREVAKRARISALAIATIRKLGETYTIDFKIIDPESGDNLFTTREEGRGQDSILGMIDRLSEETRIDFKEAESSVQMASQGIGDVTTNNLEAYHQYFLGEQYMSQLNPQKAEEAYRNAVMLDSTFGLAYYGMAKASTWILWDYEEAKEPLGKALALIDRIPEKEKYMIRALEQRIKGDLKGFKESTKVLKEMEKYYPNDKEMLYRIGDNASHMLDDATAIQYLDRVLAMDPNHQRALQHLAQVYYSMGQIEMALQFVDSLAHVNPKAAYEARGTYLSELGDYDAAVENFEEILKLDPENLSIMMHYSRALRNNQQPSEALAISEKMLALRKSPWAYAQHGFNHLMIGNVEKAKEVLNEGINRFPQDRTLMTYFGNALAYSGEYEKAEAYMRNLSENGQTDHIQSWGQLLLAAFYPYLGKYRQSEALYDALTDSAESRNDTLGIAAGRLRKALTLLRARKNEKAVLAAIDAAKDSKHDYIRFLQFYAYFWLGDSENASKLNDDRAPRLYMKVLREAHLLFLQKQWQEAIAKFDELTHLNPGLDVYSSFLAAQCYVELGKLEQAIERIQQSRDSAPFEYDGWTADHYNAYAYPQSFKLLGELYERKGNRELAIENTGKFLDLWKDADEDLPDLIEAKATLSRLKGAGGS